MDGMKMNEKEKTNKPKRDQIDDCEKKTYAMALH